MACREGGPFRWTPLFYLAYAATTGHADLIDYLVAHGAPPLGLDPAEAFVAAALAADRPGLDRLRRAHPGLAGQVRSARSVRPGPP